MSSPTTPPSATITVELTDTDDQVYERRIQHWDFGGLDPAPLLTQRPLIASILRDGATVTIDPPGAVQLGTELAGVLPDVLHHNRDHVTSVLHLIERCAASNVHRLRFTTSHDAASL